jgi:hypothetical protein
MTTNTNLEMGDMKKYLEAIAGLEVTQSCICCNRILLKGSFDRENELEFFAPVSRAMMEDGIAVVEKPYYEAGVLRVNEGKIRGRWCSECFESLRKSEVPKFSKGNLYLGPMEYPNALEGLTWEEWRCLSIVIPFHSIFRFVESGLEDTHIENIISFVMWLQAETRTVRNAGTCNRSPQ